MWFGVISGFKKSEFISLGKVLNRKDLTWLLRY